jgi:hypothetical protein
VHALGFSVSTSRLLATDLHTETVTSVTTSITHQIFQLHFRYRCTVAHINLSVYTIHLHTQTSCILLFGASGLHLETSKNWAVSQSQSQSHIATDSQSVSQSVLVSSPHLGLMTRYLLLFDSYSLVIVGTFWLKAEMNISVYALKYQIKVFFYIHYTI